MSPSPIDVETGTASKPSLVTTKTDEVTLKEGEHKSLKRQLLDSFKANPDPNARVLEPKLKARHLKMIAVGGSIGTGLFVGLGKGLSTGGPASLLIAFGLIGMTLYCTMQSLGELAVLFPVQGSFATYSGRFIDPAWGFAMSWNYAMQWLIVLPLEIIAASITINFWDHEKYPHAIFVSIFLLIITMLNLYGVQAYGEAEFWCSTIKVITVIGFIILGIVLNCGGGLSTGQYSSYVGGQFWQHPGAFNNGLKGLCSVFVIAAFSFAGTELVGLAACEAQNPRKAMPSAIKQVFWRIALFYVTSIAIIGLLVPYTDHRLLGNAGPGETPVSPFVIVIKNASIQLTSSVINTVIVISILSVGNASVFASSRVLCALGMSGQAPKVLGYIDRRGRPLVAIAVALTIGLLGYTADLICHAEVLEWMLAISALSSIFTWASINLAHLRFRRAWRQAGMTLDDLPYRSNVGIIGSWVGLLFNVLVLVAQFWVGAWPINYSAQNQAETFFKAFLAVPIVIIFYFGYRIINKTSFVRTRDMDITTGRIAFDVVAEKALEKEERRQWSKRDWLYNFFC